tara:strand:- start:214 stop:798 length:585 start_codon:yes stop_codon:yes gene_type:complete
MNRLFGMRTYLVGAMDRVSDGGVEWREKLNPELNKLGVVVFNPCNKAIPLANEDEASRARRKKYKSAGAYNSASEEMKEIRNVDLRMVDISDFIIANIDLDVHACGTYEEITTANRQKKPIIVRMKQGKPETPDWLLGMLGSSHDMIFNTWEQIIDYLKSINGCSESSVKNLNHHGRWVFFDLHSLYDKILNGV